MNTYTKEQIQLPFQHEPLKRPVILAIVYFEEYAPHQILVLTTDALLQYHFEQDIWTAKGLPIEDIDMEFMEREIWRAANCEGKKDFATFRDSLYFNSWPEDIDKELVEREIRRAANCKGEKDFIAFRDALYFTIWQHVESIAQMNQEILALLRASKESAVSEDAGCFDLS